MLQKLGRYEIIDELGRGAMGIVYKAMDPAIGRLLAIKTIRVSDFSAPHEIEALKTRLTREAQSAGSLSHPNIITIFDVGEENGLSYFAMELVEGVSLEDILQSDQTLSESTILNIARQVADALDYAHQQGIVHRDIKPGNIMLTQSGRVKIADFGIAKVGTAKMTQAGMLLGSPQYMAPEQYRGQSLDGRSDIFAFGVVLYELLTGQPPFTGEDLASLSYSIVHEDAVPPVQLKPTISAEMNQLVVKALARNPEQRFQTAAELRSVLDDIVARNASSSVTIETHAVTRADENKPGGGGRRLAKTLTAAAPKKKSSAPSLLMLVAILILAVAVSAFGLFYPGLFRQTVHSARVRAQHWLDWIARRSGPPAESISRVPAASDADKPAAISSARPSAEDSQPDRKTTAVKSESPPAKQTSTGGKTQDLRSAQSDGSSSQAALGSVQVSSNPPGAHIVFDDRDNESWVTPYTFKNVTAGRHTLDIKKPGYSTERRVIITFGTETQRVDLVLSAASGTLEVSTTPAGAQIFVDGELKSEVSPARLKLPAGSRRIVFRKEGFRDVERVIEIKDSVVTTVEQHLLEKR